MEQLLTPAQLGNLLQVPELQILEWRRQYTWPSVKVGKTIRFTEDQVDEIVKRHTERSAAPVAPVPDLPRPTPRSAAYHRNRR